jgi:glutamate-ammonia-ligase adenylyltransferase
MGGKIRTSDRIWSAAIKGSADPQRAEHFYQLLQAPIADLSRLDSESARILAALFSGSNALGAVLVAHPEWLSLLSPEASRFPRRKEGLLGELSTALDPLLERREFEPALNQLRQFKQSQMLRVGARDLARLGSIEEITRELSDIADVCLEHVWKICFARLTERHGIPRHQDAEGKWHETPGCVLGLGKLGGQELNYSSDVDVIFVYEEEGRAFTGSAGRNQKSRAGLTNHQFYCRLAEAFIGEVSRMSLGGVLYRIDLRLRPEGDQGPLARSVSSYENYYAQWGQTWERMMLIKARAVAGDERLGAEFLEMIQSFRYPRSINQSVLQEVAAMKDRIENEVVRQGELDRNVKLGRGGIREIEFVAQSQQLLHAGKHPFLQGNQTLPCLDKLVQYEFLERKDAIPLAAAYKFLRDIEHRLQMEGDLQTHTIPEDRVEQERLAQLMGIKNRESLELTLRNHAETVRTVFEKVLKRDVPFTEKKLSFPQDFENSKTEWTKCLADYGFRDLEKAFRVLREFVEGPGYVHVSPRTQQLARQIIPRLLSRGARPGRENLLSDPDRVVTRIDSFIAAYGARSTLFELWNRNPAIFDLLVLLFDRSEFLAELAIRTPDLVDELVTSGRLRQRKQSSDTLEDLRHGLSDEDQHAWLRKYHQAEFMRIGLRDILGLADEEQYLDELSALADACLQYAVEVVMRTHRLKAPPFAIIGLGKLGGAEIDYGSDLDVLFVTGEKKLDTPRRKSKTSGADKKAGARDLIRIAGEVIDLLSRRTEDGIVFHTDARLRPDGEKGLLVNTLPAYEEYYRQRAALWEIQTLTRSRAVAGDRETGAAFESLATAFASFRDPDLPLVACTRDWKEKIHEMRMRIEKERTPAGKDALAIKTGKGGLMDAEFVAQMLCLQNGWREPNTLAALEKGVANSKVETHHLKASSSPENQALPPLAKLVAAYKKLRRVEGILRRWSYEGETVLPDDPAPYYRVSVRCGFASSDDFRAAVASWRTDIREGYLAAFGKL